MADTYKKLKRTAKEIDDTLDKVADKVDKISGKSLSTEDFTTAEKQKLATLENYDDAEIKASIAVQNKYLTPEIIAADSDLNDYSGDTLGNSNYRIYYTQTQAVTNTVLNKPSDWVSGTFVLEVMRMGGSQYIQRLTQQSYSGSSANIYVRSKVHSTSEERWNPWFKLAMTKVDTDVQTNIEGGI